MRKKIRVLVNPNSGLFHSLQPVEDILSALRKNLAGAKIVVSATEREARAYLREAREKPTRFLVLAGGDGTVHAAAQVLAGSEVPIGIVPLGTANNIAAALGIPGPLGEAIRCIKGAEPARIDLGKVGRTYFVEAAGMGFHADAISLYDRYSRKSLVRSMYSFARTILETEPARVRLNIDGERLVRDAFQITFSNLPLYGTGFSLAPDARYDDGLLDVTVVGDIEKERILQYLLSAKLGTFSGLPGVEIYRATRVVVESDRPINFHIDAAHRRAKRFVVGAAPSCLTVLVP